MNEWEYGPRQSLLSEPIKADLNISVLYAAVDQHRRQSELLFPGLTLH